MAMVSTALSYLYLCSAVHTIPEVQRQIFDGRYIFCEGLLYFLLLYPTGLKQLICEICIMIVGQQWFVREI